MSDKDSAAQLNRKKGKRVHPTEEFRETFEFIESGGFDSLPGYRRREIQHRRSRRSRQGWKIPSHEIPSTTYANPEAKRARLRNVIAEHTHLGRRDFMIGLDEEAGQLRPFIYRIDTAKGRKK